ncbi:MAG: pyridoxal-phosphate dependent enzyme, partial [Alphaproteobacteria bacterium]|nr:pyridoxal-phosphate dependent enzyme [Alphaproteobacteria bacterium]
LFPLLRDLVDDAVLISDDAVKASMRRLVTANKMIAEPSGALALAAALAIADEKRGPSVCIVTGGSIDPRKLATILGDTQRVEA